MNITPHNFDPHAESIDPAPVTWANDWLTPVDARAQRSMDRIDAEHAAARQYPPRLAERAQESGMPAQAYEPGRLARILDRIPFAEYWVAPVLCFGSIVAAASICNALGLLNG